MTDINEASETEISYIHNWNLHDYVKFTHWPNNTTFTFLYSNPIFNGRQYKSSVNLKRKISDMLSFSFTFSKFDLALSFNQFRAL